MLEGRVGAVSTCADRDLSDRAQIGGVTRGSGFGWGTLRTHKAHEWEERRTGKRFSHTNTYSARAKLEKNAFLHHSSGQPRLARMRRTSGLPRNARPHPPPREPVAPRDTT